MFLCCSTTWLRYRIKRDYVDTLNIHPTTNPNLSDLVTCHDALLTEIVADEHVLTEVVGDTSTSQSDITDAPNSSGLANVGSSFSFPTMPDTECFHSALHLRSFITESDAGINHPPDPCELSLERAKSVVPSQLFNFICLASGVSKDIPDSPDQFLSVPNEEKVLSICQDIIGLTGKATPKSLALGLTVRHASGSRYLLNLLHGLGHCPSYDTVLRAETALAYKQAANQQLDYVPEGFEKQKIVILVYDNIDFQEETLSGSGTSHYTNGIMYQVAPTGSQIHTSAKISLPASKKTFTPTKDAISPFYLFKKTGPTQQQDLPPSCIKHHIKSREQDMRYLLLKLSDKSSPGTWTGVNILTNHPLDKSSIHYLPIIEASPTEVSTVKHILTSAVKMADSMDIPSVVVVFDQAIYCKAQMIRWNDAALQDRLLIRLGEFHTIMSFLAAMGKRFEKSGLEDLLVESEVVAVGSLKGVMNGHMYNRAMRAHKILFEALGILQWKEFLATCSDEQREQATSITDLLQHRLSAGLSLTSDSDECKEIISKFDDHVQQRCSESSLYQYWNSYMDMVSILLGFVRGTRTGNLSLHLSCLRQMLPYFFAYDRVNYARYVYLAII